MNAYELFTKKINNQEQKECLQLLLYTQQGNWQFAQLLHTLINYYSKDSNIDLSKILIKKDINNNIQLCNTYQYEKRKSPKKEKVIKFMKYLFQNHYKSQYIIDAEQDWNIFQKWIAAFEKIWFPKKSVIHKVINKIGSINYPQLLLLPNQNIIHSKSNNQNSLILQNSFHLNFNGIEYLNNQFWNEFFKEKGQQDSYNEIYISWNKFIGLIDPIHLIPIGEGKLYNQEKQSYFGCDQFFYTIPNGKFTHLQFNNQDIKRNKGDGSDFRKNNSISFSDEFNITPNLSKSLFDGGWLNQILVDYLIKKYNMEQKLINQRLAKYQIIVMDTRQAQDIFSSQITKNEEINLEYAQQFWNDQNFEVNKSMRLIILINVDRCHFICICIEEDVIYILNSMNSTWSDNIVGQQVNKFYQLLKTKKSQIKIQSQDQVSSYQQQVKIQILNVPQQRNGYDCSIYTLFNSMQLIKHSHTKITDIDFQVSPLQISELRFQFFQDLINNNAFLSNQKVWYPISR
ncbi:unnamed protein product [Paramecium pentaurelia]|uniref:Ubiquitin-like protease family profile domain-containing protein n=1 Tax=Paramecium pentaurelia TaxID=43138 RepID=A0A8S1SL75_9CILI|nr:unnamed protein product [Paramecium pentaurelia]